MNIKQFIEAEKIESINSIKTDIAEGYMNETELNDYFIQEINNEIEVIVYKNIKEKVKFDLINNLDGSFYKSMIGKGEQIDYSDLFEILKRLYAYHHKDNTFTLKFDSFEKEITFEVLDGCDNIGRFVMDIVGTEWFLNASDFK